MLYVNDRRREPEKHWDLTNSLTCFIASVTLECVTRLPGQWPLPQSERLVGKAVRQRRLNRLVQSCRLREKTLRPPGNIHSWLWLFWMGDKCILHPYGSLALTLQCTRRTMPAQYQPFLSTLRFVLLCIYSQGVFFFLRLGSWYPESQISSMPMRERWRDAVSVPEMHVTWIRVCLLYSIAKVSEVVVTSCIIPPCHLWSDIRNEPAGEHTGKKTYM